MQVKGLIAERRSGRFYVLPAVRLRDRASPAGRDRAGLAKKGITNRPGSSARGHCGCDGNRVDASLRSGSASKPFRYTTTVPAFTGHKGPGPRALLVSGPGCPEFQSALKCKARPGLAS